MTARKASAGATSPSSWRPVHRAMPEWERPERRVFCALMGVHLGLVEWPCPDAPAGSVPVVFDTSPSTN